MDQQNMTAHMAWVVHIINSYTRRDKLSHEDGSVQKILKISGLSSGVSPRFFTAVKLRLGSYPFCSPFFRHIWA